MDAVVAPKLIVICGPTGIGKTSVSLVLAKVFSGCVVSADSMQVYRHMDIGTAKPSPHERAEVEHFMMDLVDPDEPFDAAMYAAGGRKSIDRIHARRRIPFVVGGTGFYIKALLHGLCGASPADPVIRQKLKDEANRLGGRPMHDRLKSCDPEAASRIHPNDTYRIIRAIEIYQVAGIPLSEYQKRHGFEEQTFNVLKIGLGMDRAALYDRINRRVDRMIEKGLQNEVKGLLQRGYSESLKPMQAIGYRHMTGYLSGRMPWNEALETLKRDTRRYAKRQVSWFKKDPELVWKPCDDVEGIKALVQQFLED
jgi:tRNA dimethylallyltransferase